MTGFWHPASSLPTIDRSVCLCAYNGIVLPDMFVWLAERKHFIGQTSSVDRDGKRIAHDFIVKPIEIEWWGYKLDLPALPSLAS